MLQSRVISRSDYVNELTAVIEGPQTCFFVDSSFLLALGSLNDLARAEITAWIDALGDRFRVPAWVAHELYGKVNKEQTALTPMATYASDLLKGLALVQKEARRFLTDERAKSFDNQKTDLPRDRITFLSELDREVGGLLKRANYLRKISAKNVEATAEAVIALVENRVIASDIYADLRDVQAIHSARLVGSLPPGAADRRKDENKYGDLIIWLEIVRGCKGLDAKAIVLLSNDAKPDWVYSPPRIKNDQGAIVSNTPLDGFSVVFPQPLLVHEIRQSLPSTSLSLINLATLAVLLHQKAGGKFGNLFAAYEASGSPAAPDLPEGGLPLTEEAQTNPVPPQAELPKAVVAPSAGVRDLIRAIGKGDPQEVSAAIAALRPKLEGAVPADDLLLVGRALAEAAETGSEPAAILVRGIARGELGAAHASELIDGLFSGTYFDEAGAIRDRPLGALIDDLFAAQNRAELAGSVKRIRSRLSAHQSRFLLLPNVTNERVKLELATAPRSDGEPQVMAIVRGAKPLTIDMLPGAPGTVAAALSGDSATVEQIRRLVAEHFCVPGRLVDFNLTRSERVTFDDMLGLIPWGANTQYALR